MEVQLYLTDLTRNSLCEMVNNINLLFINPLFSFLVLFICCRLCLNNIESRHLTPRFPRYSYPSQHMRWRVTILNVAKRGGEDSVSVVLAVMWETINEAE